MRRVVLVGHRHSCPIHGEGTVTSGVAEATIGGRAVACVQDTISCGAVITTGSADFTIDGRPVAREGDHTSHGGTLVEGDDGWLID